MPLRSGNHPAVAELNRRNALNRFADEQLEKSRRAVDCGLSALAEEHAQAALLARIESAAISTDADA